MQPLFEGTKNVSTYWAASSIRGKYVLVIKEGRCGDNFGYIRDIETGDEWRTYGYDNLEFAGTVVMKYQFFKE